LQCHERNGRLVNIFFGLEIIVKTALRNAGIFGDALNGYFFKPFFAIMGGFRVKRGMTEALASLLAKCKLKARARTTSFPRKRESPTGGYQQQGIPRQARNDG
jgi:hypothetical protein